MLNSGYGKGEVHRPISEYLSQVEEEPVRTFHTPSIIDGEIRVG